MNFQAKISGIKKNFENMILKSTPQDRYSM